MIELVIVVGLIIVIAAVAAPSITAFMRTYRVRGAAQQVAGEIQTARNKAIMRNVNEGVVFAIFDNNTYRWVIDDEHRLPLSANNAAALGPLRDLPEGVEFVASTQNGFFYDRLGRRSCKGAPACAAYTAAELGDFCPDTAGGGSNGDQLRCGDSVPGNYVDNSNPNGTRIQVRDITTRIVRTIEIAPGGRVLRDR